MDSDMITLEFEDEIEANADGFYFGDTRYVNVCYQGIPFSGMIDIKQNSYHESRKLVTFRNGLLHSFDDLPAVVIPNLNFSSWWVNGEHHRETGPARIYELRLFFVFQGMDLNFNEWLALIDVSDAEKVMLKIQYG